MRALLVLAVISRVLAEDGYGSADPYNSYGAYNQPAAVPAPTPPPPAPAPPAPAPPTPAPSDSSWWKNVLNGNSNGPNRRPTPPPAPELATTSRGACHWVRDPRCKFPFMYDGKYYNDCTGANGLAMNWCSLDYRYRGNYVNCKRDCAGNNNNVGKIIAGVVGGSAVAAGVGVAIATIVKNEQDRKNHSTTAAPVAPLNPNATWVPATGPDSALPAGVAVKSYPIPVAVPQAAPRLYDGDQKVAPSTGVASYFSGPTLAFVGLLALFSLVAVIGVRRRKQKRVQQATFNTAESQDVEVPHERPEIDEEPLLCPSLTTEVDA